MNTKPSRPVRRTPVLLSAAAALAIAVTAAHPVELSAQTDAVKPADVFTGLSYRSVGPSRGGRVTAVAGHRDHPLAFYMGATGGGVWKTEDYGTTWHPISDGQIATGSIGAIRVAQSNSSVVYVGTGSDGIRSNVIRGLGVYRSDDGGDNWRHIGLRDAGQIEQCLVPPARGGAEHCLAIAHALGDHGRQRAVPARAGERVRAAARG